MYCTNCGKEVSDGYLFCIECGAPVPEDGYEGAGRQDDAVFRHGNGPAQPVAGVTSQVPASHAATPSAKTAPRRTLAIVAAVLAVLVCGGAAWALTGGLSGGHSPSVTVIGEDEDYADIDLDALFSAPVGSTVTFGSYEQDGDASNGAEPLEWVVVAKQGSRTQLVTKDLVDCQPYASENMGFAWIKSDLRTWLNGEFVDAALTEGERKLVRDTIVAYPGQPADVYSPIVTEPEWDESFLLSCAQANAAFPSDGERIAVPSAYAAGMPDAPADASWWLRDTGFERQGAAQVTTSGEVDSYGVSVVDNSAYARPSLWVAEPASMLEGSDEEGRYGVYADAVSYMSDESLYALADLDDDGSPELVVLSSAWDDPDTWGVYLYGYGDGQALYLGSCQIAGCSSVSLVMAPGKGLYVLGDGSTCTLLLVTLDGGSCSAQTLAQGSHSEAEQAAGLAGDELGLVLYSCGDLSGLETIPGGWSSQDSGTVGAGFVGGSAVPPTMLDRYRGQATEGMTSTVIDVTDEATRHDLNLFLSNFTEKSSTFTFDWETCTDEEMCLFSIDHTRLNNPDAILDASGAGYQSADGRPCTERVDWETFAKYPRVFLKKDFDESDITDPCFLHDGYVCFPGDGWHVPNGVAYVTSTTDIGEGRVLVTFDVYGDGVDYVVTDESYYTCTADELQRKLGVSGVSRTGSAIVERCDDGTVAPFKLWAFESE